MPTLCTRNGKNRLVAVAIFAIALAGCGAESPTNPGGVAVASATVSAPSEAVEQGATLQLTALVPPSAFRRA